MPFCKRIYSLGELQFIAARSWQRMKGRVLQGRAAESLGNETLRYPALRSTPREIAGSKNRGWRIRPAVYWWDVCALSKGAQTCQTTARLRHPSFFMSFRGPTPHLGGRGGVPRRLLGIVYTGPWSVSRRWYLPAWSAS